MVECESNQEVPKCATGDAQESIWEIEPLNECLIKEEAQLREFLSLMGYLEGKFHIKILQFGFVGLK